METSSPLMAGVKTSIGCWGGGGPVRARVSAFVVLGGARLGAMPAVCDAGLVALLASTLSTTNGTTADEAEQAAEAAEGREGARVPTRGGDAELVALLTGSDARLGVMLTPKGKEGKEGRGATAAPAAAEPATEAGT